MRARLGVLFAGLRLAGGAVIDESRDIMVWALEQQDPQGLLDATVLDQANALIEKNDNEFRYLRGSGARSCPVRFDTEARPEG